MGECHMCLLAGLPVDAGIYSEAGWTIVSPVPVPGWMMLLTTDHNEGFWELDPREAARFGELALALSQAVREVCGPERVYLMYAGENALHFHAMVLPRGAEVPEDWRGPGLIGHHADLHDVAATERVAEAVRTVLARTLMKAPRTQQEETP